MTKYFGFANKGSSQSSHSVFTECLLFIFFSSDLHVASVNEQPGLCKRTCKKSCVLFWLKCETFMKKHILMNA